MKCPTCNNDMFSVESNRITLDTCHKCKGIWFDRGELGHADNSISAINFKVPRIADVIAVENSPEAPRKCPRCEKTMKKGLIFNQPPLIDFCADGHGMWFDGGELGRYVRNNKTKGRLTPFISFLGENFSARLTEK